jgi:hypothetical protein
MHYVADNFVVVLGNEIELGNEVGVAPKDMRKVVLIAPGRIQIPERFTGELFYRAVIVGLFVSDCDIHHVLQYWFIPK